MHRFFPFLHNLRPYTRSSSVLVADLACSGRYRSRLWFQTGGSKPSAGVFDWPHRLLLCPSDCKSSSSASSHGRIGLDSSSRFDERCWQRYWSRFLSPGQIVELSQRLLAVLENPLLQLLLVLLQVVETFHLLTFLFQVELQFRDPADYPLTRSCAHRPCTLLLRRRQTSR